MICLGLSIFNRRMNEIYGKTLTNTPEAIFCLLGLRFYNRLKPKVDRDMILMTLSITAAFLIRSSSLIGWIPLALVKMFTSFDYFTSIVKSGLVVAIPAMMLGIAIDSVSYGKLTVPQVNFVHVNVVENISKYFGTDPFSFYIKELPEFVNSLDGINTAGFGLCWLTVS